MYMYVCIHVIYVCTCTYTHAFVTLVLVMKPHRGFSTLVLFIRNEVGCRDDTILDTRRRWEVGLRVHNYLCGIFAVNAGSAKYRCTTIRVTKYTHNSGES